MYDTTQKITPPTIFGDLFIQEQHSDAADRHLPPSDIGKVIESLKASMLHELLKSTFRLVHSTVEGELQC